MDFSKINVLVLDGNGRQTLTMVHGLKEIGCKVASICQTKKDLCYASKLPDEKLMYSGKLYTEEFHSFVIEALKTNKYDVIMPIGDFSTEYVTSHEDELKKYVRLACATRSAFEKASNKQYTLETAMRLGIPCANTRLDGQDIHEYLKTASFPIIIKPRNGTGSIGFHKLNTEEEFWSIVKREKINIDEYVVQEFVDHQIRHGTYILVDQHGVVKSALASEVIRWYPIDAGTSTVSMSVDDPHVIEYAGKLLAEIGWQGFANIGFMIEKETGNPKLLEINGRIPAPMKLTWMCGINAAKQLIEMVYDQEVTDYGKNTKYGMMARHSQADLMWFVKSPNRFKAKPSWFSWKNTSDLVYWKGDPKPAIVYTLRAFTQYGKFMKMRKR